ncbi:TPA: protein kinase [Candidatus Woesearchaeota archaeon]|nr:protein kinase [Candidatus Woesearchaeota archaeon]
MVYTPSAETGQSGRTRLGGISSDEIVALGYALPAPEPSVAAPEVKPRHEYSADSSVDTEAVTNVVGPRRADTQAGAVDFRDLIENNGPQTLYEHPDAIRILAKYTGVEVPLNLKQRLQEDPDHELLFEQFKEYVRQQAVSKKSQFYAAYDPDSMRVLGNGGCSLIVQMFRRDFVGAALDDSVVLSDFPETAAVKLEYSSSKRPLQNVRREKQMQILASDLTGRLFDDMSGVLPLYDDEVFADNTFSYRRPPAVDARLRADIAKVLADTGQFPEHKIDSICDVVLEYHIETLAMPVETSPSLDNYLKTNNLPLDELVDLFMEIVDVVSELHDGKLVHRDLKPANIKVREVVEEGKVHRYVTVLDFGLADFIGEWAVNNGTFEYMGARQLRDNIVMPSNDIQSLGIILYEMIAGFNPRRSSNNKDDYVREMLHKIQSVPMNIVEDPVTNQNVSIALGAVIMNAVHPDGVYSTCREFAVDVREALKDSPEIHAITARQRAQMEGSRVKYTFPRVEEVDGVIYINGQMATSERLARVVRLTGRSLDQLMDLRPDDVMVKRFKNLEAMDVIYRVGKVIDFVHSDEDFVKDPAYCIDIKKHDSATGMLSVDPLALDEVPATDPRRWFASSVGAVDHSASDVRRLNADVEAEQIMNYFSIDFGEEIAEANPALAAALDRVTLAKKKDKDK